MLLNSDKETIRYDSVCEFMSFRTFTDDFDYNLRFLILEVLVRVLYDRIFRLLYSTSTSTFHSTSTHPVRDHSHIRVLTSHRRRTTRTVRVPCTAEGIVNIHQRPSTTARVLYCVTGTSTVLYEYCTRTNTMLSSTVRVQDLEEQKRTKYKIIGTTGYIRITTRCKSQTVQQGTNTNTMLLPATFPPNNDDSKFKYCTSTRHGPKPSSALSLFILVPPDSLVLTTLFVPYSCSTSTRYCISYNGTVP